MSRPIFYNGRWAWRLLVCGTFSAQIFCKKFQKIPSNITASNERKSNNRRTIHTQEMTKVNCNRPRCTRCWKKSFGATPKNCEEWSPPLPHLIPRRQAQAPIVLPKPSELFEEGMAYFVGVNFKEKDLKRGQLMIEASASSGFPMAVAFCHCAGWNGMEKDLKKAFEMFVKIEQETNGYHWAQYLLGYCYHCGRGTDQDHTKAVEWFTKSSEQENSVAMYSLGACYKNGEGCVQNMTKAMEWYERSGKLGHKESMDKFRNIVQAHQPWYDLYDSNIKTRSSNNTHSNIMPYVPSANDMVRDPSRHVGPTDGGQALFEEGMASWNGSDFKKEDYKRGQLMIEASASIGFPLAVACCHYYGINGMERDDRKAFEMFVKIERETNGYHWAQYLLGNCYDFGHGNNNFNYTKVVEWYTKSSEQENSNAMNGLGFHYNFGYGCGRRLTKAVKLYEKSAKLGNSQGMYNLGNCYEKGDGVIKDLGTAQEWYAKAVAQDHAQAKVQILKCKRLHEECYKKSEKGKKLFPCKRKNKQKRKKTKRTKTE